MSYLIVIIELGVIPSSEVGQCLTEFRRLILFLFSDVFSILFYIIFGNFKVLHIVLEIFGHSLFAKG
jgi:hypothetical protein